MHSKTINAALEEMQTSINGLTEKEAEKRLKQHGLNELKKTKKQSFLKCFLKQFLNIMVAILMVAAIVSLSIAIINKEYADLFEGFVILFIVIMNALIGVFQEQKAQACLEDLQKYTKTTVKVVRNGIILNVDSTLLVPGDIVELQAGNVAMADMRLISSNNFSADESSLTGESVPIEKLATDCLKPNTPLAERKNMVYSGSMITTGKAVGLVVAPNLAKLLISFLILKRKQHHFKSQLTKLAK